MQGFILQSQPRWLKLVVEDEVEIGKWLSCLHEETHLSQQEVGEKKSGWLYYYGDCFLRAVGLRLQPKVNPDQPEVRRSERTQVRSPPNDAYLMRRIFMTLNNRCHLVEYHCILFNTFVIHIFYSNLPYSSHGNPCNISVNLLLQLDRHIKEI